MIGTQTQTQTNQQNSQPSHPEIRDIVAGLPWEISFSKLPGHDEETIQFTSDEVGVMRHFVEVKPVHTTAGILYGYRVEKRHTGQKEPTVVEDDIGARGTALDAARDCMDRLTN